MGEKKIFQAICSGEKLPRRIKKRILGRKLNKRSLKKLLASVRVTEATKSCEEAMIQPYLFCPRCGCQESRLESHYVEWPEVWYETFCLRCGLLVGGANNSVYHHILEEIE